jgi:ankyrin repeat protein
MMRMGRHMASWRGSTSSMAALLDAGADMTITNRLGRTPLHTAAYYGTSIHSPYLQPAHDLVWSRNAHRAIGHSDCVALLRKRGAAIGVKDARDFLPAHCAACMGHTTIATSLGVG